MPAPHVNKEATLAMIPPSASNVSSGMTPPRASGVAPMQDMRRRSTAHPTHLLPPHRTHRYLIFSYQNRHSGGARVVYGLCTLFTPLNLAAKSSVNHSKHSPRVCLNKAC